MSYLSVLAAIRQATVYAITVADVGGGTVFGFSLAGADGAVTPTTFKGAVISGVSSRTAAAGSQNNVQVVLETSLAQSFFAGILVLGTDGVWRRYMTADAVFTTFGAAPVLSSWNWPGTQTAWTTTGSRAFHLIH